MYRLRPSSKVLALGVAAITAVLTLAACGSSDEATDSVAVTAAESSAVESSQVESSEVESSAEATSGSNTGSSETGSSEAAGDLTDCTPDTLTTFSGTGLTVATSEPVFEPWMVDNDPTNGKGYESAVAYAVAEKLGYTKDQVNWVRVSFEAAIAPTPKEFDFDINQFSITPERQAVLDFSTGYYDVTQTLITVKGSPIEKITDLAGLKDAKLGAMLGTTSLASINASIEPTTAPAVFDDNIAAAGALQNGQIDGLVIDLPTAFYMTGAQLTDGMIIGQLPATGEDLEQLGLLLDKDSPLTPCVSAAVDSLRADGTLDALAQEWIAASGAPELK